MDNTLTTPTRRSQWLKALRVMVAVTSVVVGGMIVLITAALGHCSAFGGTCPSQTTWDGDVFGGAAMGTLLAVGGVLWMRRPSWQGLLRALVMASVVAIAVGGLVMAGSRG